MVDRFLAWMSTAVVTAGVTAAVVAGAGVAMATDGDAGDDGVTKTSESVDSPANKDDSAAEDTSPNVDGPDEQGDDPAGVEPDPDQEAIDGIPVNEDAIDEGPTDGTVGDDLTDGTAGEDPIDEDTTEANGDAGELGEGVEPTQAAAGADKNGVAPGNSQIAQWTQALIDHFGPVAKTANENVEISQGPETDVVEERAFVNVANSFEEANEQTETPELMSVAFAAPAAAQVNAAAFASPLTVVLDMIGTIVFGLYSILTQTVGGPPVIPVGSNVTVHSSRLRIDCGCAPGEGASVPVDWYVPQTAEGAPPPERLIYLQHGFLASAPWYSYTAHALAQQTNSIVVAPSITSNFLASNGCWLGGAPMHEAMAGLFDENNTALAESAARAGYNGLLPDRVVLMGHSLGGGAVSGIAGYMSDNGTDDRLAGVILLDGVGLNGEMANDLRKVDLDIPIYQLAAPKYFWNQSGSGTDALIEARPDADFYGVTLVGGSHVDTMRGGNPLIQFSQQLVSGFSTPANVSAARTLMVGWTNDMFTGAQGAQRVGIYLEGAESRTINTPGGEATLVNLPNSLTKPFILDILLGFLRPFTGANSSLFAVEPACVAESIGSADSCPDPIAA